MKTLDDVFEKLKLAYPNVLLIVDDKRIKINNRYSVFYCFPTNKNEDVSFDIFAELFDMFRYYIDEWLIFEENDTRQYNPI